MRGSHSHRLNVYAGVLAAPATDASQAERMIARHESKLSLSN